MAKKGKAGREKRKQKNKNGAFSAFVKNKWNGKEPVEDFWRREFRLWNNLPSVFKNTFRKVV